ncbi:DUF2304 domain-containing protein [Lentisphaerota bacterium ZTH]|nr:DUF2304 domain-containing protein [Lentisphaerota bacterium]WET05741.1 DUF2304 domain-containing protein [Lentisphaerota bacterium ZTH]
MNRIQIVSVIASFGFLFFIFEIIRQKKLKEAYALIWVIMGFFFLILSCWLQGLHFFSRLIGIAYSPATLFLVLIITLILIMIQFSIVISRQVDKLKNMAQEIALLKNHIEMLGNDKKTKTN